MVLMCVVFNAKQKTDINDTSDYSSSQLLLSNMGVAAQKINLVGYQVILNAPTGTAVADTTLPLSCFCRTRLRRRDATSCGIFPSSR